MSDSFYPYLPGDVRTEHRHLMRFGEHETLAQSLWEERDTTVRAVAAELAKLWTAPAGQDNGADPVIREEGTSHARTSVLNLIVTVLDEGAADRVVDTMLELGVRHPSRVIVLVPDPHAAGPSLDARIAVHCHPFQRDRICYEEVVLTVRGDAAEHLSGVVAPLLIHDLPTHVWWPGAPPFDNPVFDQLVEMGDRLIVDSADFEDLLAGLRRLAAVRRRSGVGDLAWERLGWWQELTAQFFDAPRFRRYLPNLNRLHVKYAMPATPGPPDEVEPSVVAPIVHPLLYAGWIGTRLGWRRDATLEPLEGGRFRLRMEGRYEMVEVLIEPEPTDDVVTGELTAARLRALGEAGAAEFIIDRAGDEATVATNADGMTALLRRVVMEMPREAELLSRQLTSEVVDPVYADALRAAAILLSSARTAGAA
jgi:glucose-6-phosphate dehydrogenase assembly protein OpcA